MNKKYIAVFALMTLALVGCTQPIDQVQPTPQPTRNLPNISTQLQIPNVPTIETSDFDSMFNEGNPTNAPQVTQQTSTTGIQRPTPITTESSDQKKYSAAIKNKDAKLCELIQDANTKATCVKDVAALSQESNPKAVVTTDEGTTSQENLNQ